MVFDKHILDELSTKAKASLRLRANLDLRTSPDDMSQRMLNALEPGTVVPIHRHRETSETVVIVRGSILEKFYDEEGKVTEQVLMKPDGDVSVLSVEKGRWHNVECLEPNTIIFESKDGAYKPLSDEDIMK